MTRIGFLIPEFPGQTHAFFMRERVELAKLEVETELISTRRPLAGIANHAWAEEAAKVTTYLFPLSKGQIISSIGIIVLAGPLAWFRCLAVIFGKSDMGANERLKMFAMMIAGAFLLSSCQRKGLRHVHIHSCANSANVALFARLLGGPTYSLTLHGPMHDYGTNQARKWGNAAYCIVITNELMTEVKDNLRHIALPPIYLAPMGVNINDFRRSSAYTPVRSGETIKLVSCARLNFVKAHDDLIRVVARLKEKGFNAQLNICGATDSVSDVENYFDELKKLRSELGVEDRVNFLGSLSENRIKEELESAHYFCLASLKEPLGVAIMEAMAMELPVIVTRSPGVCEMVDNGVDGILVEPRSPEQFVEAIMHLVNSPGVAIDIAHKGRMKIVRHFHSGISASRIVDGLKHTP
jgi:colanic acid/amylovoran biosynthesis glycosyltransferase